MNDVLDLIIQLLGAAFTIKETLNNEKIASGETIRPYDEINKLEPEYESLKWENLGRTKVAKLKKVRKKESKR